MFAFFHGTLYMLSHKKKHKKNTNQNNFFCHAIVDSECQSETMSDSSNMIASQSHTATEQVTGRYKGLHSITAYKCTCMQIHLVRLTQFTKPQCRDETAGNGELVLVKKIPEIVRNTRRNTRILLSMQTED